jgi:hypothetical protein
MPKNSNQNSQKQKRSQGQRPGPSRKTAKKSVWKEVKGASQQVNAPVAVARTNITKPPEIIPKKINGHTAIVVKHRELIGDCGNGIVNTFTITNNLPLNPGMSTTFPWLNLIAQCWEKYRFRKLNFEYVTRVGTSSFGSILFAADYDAADAAPTGETIMSSYESCRESALWTNQIIPLKELSLADRNQYKYVRTEPLAANLDIKTYDSGNFYVATTGVQVDVVHGKLWVDYEVELIIPCLPPLGATFGPAHLAAVTPTAAQTLGSANAESESSGHPNPLVASIDAALQRLTLQDINPGDFYAITQNLTGTVIASLGTGLAAVSGVSNLANFVSTDNSGSRGSIWTTFKAENSFPVLAATAVSAATIASNGLFISNF